MAFLGANLSQVFQVNSAISTSSPTIIDGKQVAKSVRDKLAARISEIKSDFNSKRGVQVRSPGLGVILIGDDPASKTYVAAKEKAARESGFEAFDIMLPSNASMQQAADAIMSFNNNPAVDGILLQLPVPKGLDSDHLISLIDPKKDADGLHPVNQGLLLQGRATVKPCTPAGCIELLDSVNCQIASASAIVIGRSILVGKPAALLLLERNATVTIAHSKTKNLPELVAASDIVVAAVGIPEFVKGEWLKKGSVVIDVGINRMPDGKLKGDVHYQSALSRASAITPVPGGVGPMTIAMLLQNTLTAYEHNYLKNI